MDMDPEPGKDHNRRQYFLNLTLVGLVGQVGCVTLVIILLALFLGLWLDSRFNSKPAVTLILLVGSIPVSVLTMLFIVRKGVNKIKPDLVKQQNPNKKEESLGKDS
jgi:hypothetical protein